MPQAGALPERVWPMRPLVLGGLLALHAPVYGIVVLARGSSVQHAVFEAAIPAVFAVVGHVVARRNATAAAAAVSLGLVVCSAVLVHLSGGLVEAHFHFFVMVTLLLLYGKWLPFALAMVFVLLHHAAAGAIAPETIYNDEAAHSNPWLWAMIHGAFVAAAAAAGMTAWKFNEALVGRLYDSRRRYQDLFDNAADPLSTSDMDGNLTSANTAFIRVTGYSHAELTQMNLADLFTPSSLALAHEMAERKMRGAVAVTTY